MSQWKHSCFVGKLSRITSTVRTVMNNGNVFAIFLSVDGMLGRKALVVLSKLGRFIVEKMEETLLQVRGWVNGRITITVERSYSRMICGALIPSTLRKPELDWDLESGIGLAS